MIVLYSTVQYCNVLYYAVMYYIITTLCSESDYDSLPEVDMPQGGLVR